MGDLESHIDLAIDQNKKKNRAKDLSAIMKRI